MKKKLLLALVISAMLICLFAVGASAQIVGDLDYTLNNNGTATVSANNKTTTLENIVIPETITYVNPDTQEEKTYTVTGIANDAFMNNKSIKSIVIPATITWMGGNAFSGSTNLSSLEYLGTLENWYTKISFSYENANPMRHAKNIKTSDYDAVPAELTLKTFKNYAFVGCDTLRVVNFTEDATSVPEGAFYECRALETVNFPGALKGGIYASAFNGCSSLTAFNYDASKATYTILYGSTFSGCTSLSTFTFPKSVKQIYGNAFYGCTSLATVIIPDDAALYDIGANTFRGCTSLASINLIDGIYKLGNDAFHDAGLTYVKLPNGIATHKDRFLGYNTFMGCKNLTTIDFTNCPMVSLSTSFANNCDGLRYLSLPESMTEVSTTAFDGCDNLEAVYMPNSITTLSISGWNNGAFANCPKLYFVQNPITPVEDYSKFVMPSKPEVYFMPTSLKSQQDPSTGGIASSAGPFVSCKNLNSVLVFPEGFTNFYTNDNWFKFCGTQKNPLKIVCLGDMTDVVYNSAASERSNYISYYFMNPADQDISDVNFKSTSTAATPTGAYAVFCHSNCYYPINGKTLTEEDRVDITAETALTTTHIRNPRLDVPTDPTCTTKGSIESFCFCDPQKENKISTVEIPALGHDKDKELSYNVWAWENNNYFANAKYKHVCQVCSVEYLSEEYIENSYLFIKEGFATFANKDGETIKSYDFQYSIKVNTDAMDDYTEATGKVIKYGTVAGVGASLTNPISYENGTLTVGASAAVSDMTGTDYVKLLIKVTRIPVLEEGVKITCNAYAIVDDKLRYVGETTVTENAQFSLIK